MQRAAGKFMLDMTKGPGYTNEHLQKMRERSDNMITKAAGDGMIVGDDVHGGYLIMPAVSMMLMETSLTESFVRSNATTVPLDSQLAKLPYVQNDNETGVTSFGGVIVYFDDELDQYTASRPKQAMMELKLKKMTALAHTSMEWEKWSPVTVGGWLLPLFGQAIGWRENQVFMNGVGGAQPLGISNSKGAVSVTKETGQAADTVNPVIDRFVAWRLREMTSTKSNAKETDR